jgi:uncharacterized protein (UPF0210 family)
MSTNGDTSSYPYQSLFCVRTITAFITLEPGDFTSTTVNKNVNVETTNGSTYNTGTGVEKKLATAKQLLNQIQTALEHVGYKVQTQRIVTNPFGEWVTRYDGGDAATTINEETAATNDTQVVTKKAKLDVDVDVDVATITTGLKEQMAFLDQCLQAIGIDFCSVGPAKTKRTVAVAVNIANANAAGDDQSAANNTLVLLKQAREDCVAIVATSPRLSCSFPVQANHVAQARTAAECCLQISKLGENENESNESGAPPPSSSQDFLKGGLGNFRFCAASTTCQPFIPFFPVAYGPSIINTSSGDENSNSSSTSTQVVYIAIGLENGHLARHLLQKCKSIANVPTMFRTEMAKAVQPLQHICETVISDVNTNNSNNNSSSSDAVAVYKGIDTSLNPSLDTEGSIAAAMECLDEVQPQFGGPGTLAAAAAITTALQNLSSPDNSNIKITGYCGLMLPVCEDQRLSELAAANTSGSACLTVTQLLNVSSVCGVGVDTVPLRGNVSAKSLTALILDVAGLAERWNKPLSCRVFPVPGLGLNLNDGSVDVDAADPTTMQTTDTGTGSTGTRPMTTFEFEHLCNTRVFDL